MLIVVESDNSEVITAIAQVAKAMKASYKIESDNNSVSENERLRRIEIGKKFKGGLKKYASNYVFNKEDWYLQ